MSQKVAKNFYCENCDYATTNKFDWKKHISTTKHKNGNKMVTFTKKFICKNCKKTYKFKSGLSRHKKKCFVNSENIILSVEKKSRLTNNGNKPNGENELSETIKLMAQTVARQGNILEKLIESQNEMIPKLGNNNNNNVSINIFLNKKCTDAMNLTDFVNNIKISLEDLKYTNEHGYVKGISNIFQKNLTDLKATERPIHCSDKKRLQFYVKDDDKWEKDVDNKKLDETIRDVKLKLPKSLTEWEKMNPSYKKDPKLMDEWMNIMAGISEGDTGSVLKDKLALKRKIATYIELKEAMAAEKK